MDHRLIDVLAAVWYGVGLAIARSRLGLRVLCTNANTACHTLWSDNQQKLRSKRAYHAMPRISSLAAAAGVRRVVNKTEINADQFVIFQGIGLPVR